MKKYVILLCFIFLGMNLNAQEKNETKKSAVENTNSSIGVVDMKKILALRAHVNASIEASPAAGHLFFRVPATRDGTR